MERTQPQPQQIANSSCAKWLGHAGKKCKKCKRIGHIHLSNLKTHTSVHTHIHTSKKKKKMGKGCAY